MQTDLPDTLTWSPDTHPDITRRKACRSWSYRAPDGTRIEQATERKRIDALAVPPAYEKVWISPVPTGICRPRVTTPESASNIVIIRTSARSGPRPSSMTWRGLVRLCLRSDVKLPAASRVTI
ncbi:hypothetical protein [Ascidiaceihabitans sp.]|uniref:hypothetical protein n=1 Tax=Ascidiaceihabitans sp. TaxID=1872644 RepID=UPI003298773A